MAKRIIFIGICAMMALGSTVMSQTTATQATKTSSSAQGTQCQCPPPPPKGTCDGTKAKKAHKGQPYDSIKGKKGSAKAKSKCTKTSTTSCATNDMN